MAKHSSASVILFLKTRTLGLELRFHRNFEEIHLGFLRRDAKR
jgi:hypothetical protein